MRGRRMMDDAYIDTSKCEAHEALPASASQSILSISPSVSPSSTRRPTRQADSIVS